MASHAHMRRSTTKNQGRRCKNVSTRTEACWRRLFSGKMGRRKFGVFLRLFPAKIWARRKFAQTFASQTDGVPKVWGVKERCFQKKGFTNLRPESETDGQAERSVQLEVRRPSQAGLVLPVPVSRA
eukprot:3250572-Rhodomonas_salina.1